jgi:phospholipase/lecithinase/hemolysin
MQVIIQCFAQFPNALAHNAFIYKGTRPYGIKQLRLSDDTVTVVEQILENTERLGAERHRPVTLSQSMSRGLETPVTEAVGATQTVSHEDPPRSMVIEFLLGFKEVSTNYQEFKLSKAPFWARKQEVKEMDIKKVALWLIVALVGLILVPDIQAQPYSGVYVFGESFVDQGNAKDLFSSYFIDWPPSPPYAGGRFCNGPVFAEVVADNLQIGPLDASLAGGTNYAYGGARSVGENLFFGFIPIPSVRNQVETYLAEAGGAADPDALYILHDGGNDTFLAVTAFFEGGWGPAAEIIEESALGMIESVQILADAGAVHFVIPGAPFFSDSAVVCGVAVADALGQLYNTTLETGLAGLDPNLRILYFDLFGFETAVSEHFITDCNYCVDWNDATSFVCSNPEDRFNWDQAHVTAAVQQLIGDAITAALLRDQVLHLASTGTLNGGQTNALLAKLDGAYEKLEDRQPKTTVNKIGAFLNQVEALVRVGMLSPEEAELLLVGAQGILEQP